MPISGVVISCSPGHRYTVIKNLNAYKSVEIHGADHRGNIVTVLETDSSEEMEKLIERLNNHDHILNIGMTYLNIEDEAERMARGETTTKPFGFKAPSV